MKKVCVLLAAYNGEKYITDQLVSILKQENVLIDIFISLDYSTDSTLSIIDSFCFHNDNIYLLPYGERFGGAGKNFYNLFNLVNFNKYDYISLADQDDIWDFNKLFYGIIELENQNASALSSDVICFWEDGNKQILKKSYKQVKFDYLFESPGPGCTFILNKIFAVQLQTFIKTYQVKLPELHDWFIYAFARENGLKWHISSNPLMLYRQHENNQCGANIGFKAIYQRINLVKEGWYKSEVIGLISLLFNQQNLLKRFVKLSFLDRLILSAQVFKFRRNKKDALFLAFVLIVGIM